MYGSTRRVGRYSRAVTRTKRYIGEEIEGDKDISFIAACFCHVLAATTAELTHNFLNLVKALRRLFRA